MRANRISPPERRRSLPRSLRLPLALPALGGQAPRPAEARTLVRYQGGTDILIELPITLSVTAEADLADRPHPETGEPVAPTAYFERDIRRFWNRLAKFRYRTCFRITLEVSVNSHVGDDPPSGYHTATFVPEGVVPSSFVSARNPYAASDAGVSSLGVWTWGPVHQTIGTLLGLSPGPVTVIDQALVDRLGRRIEDIPITGRRDRTDLHNYVELT